MMKEFLVLSFFFISSCAPFVDSPFSDSLLRPERDMNTLAKAKMTNLDDDGVIRFAVFSDSHQNYKSLDEVLYDINEHKDLDFVASLGDFTNSGYNLEYDQFIDALEYLKTPKFTCLGNHDAIGAGPELFRKAFGPTNFYFESNDYRFVFFNSNNLENPKGFAPQWLKDTVSSTSKKVIIFSHVQLRDPERYFGNDATVLGSVIESSNVPLILNGHNHVYDLLMDHGTIMLQAARVEGRHWLLIEIQSNQVCIKRMDTKESDCRTLK
jgi:predicted phosphodiesterase